MDRTLIISDLHMGAYAGHSVLLREPVLTALLAKLSGYNRLVLLGDILELGERRPHHEVLEIATPVLTALGGGLGGPDPEIIVMTGNHDRWMIQPYIDACGTELPLQGEVPADTTATLAELVRLLSLGGARVSVRYPFFRLSDRVWLHHGHYLDRLLSPEGPYGFWRRPAYPQPYGYESGRIPQERPTPVKMIQKWILRPQFARLTTAGLNWQMRRHSLPALARAMAALGISAEYVVFGHVHRLGPIGADKLSEWSHALSPGAAPTHFVNTGSWVEDDLLIGDMRPPHPYWPGGAVSIEADGIPRAIEPLDDELFRDDAIAARHGASTR